MNELSGGTDDDAEDRPVTTASTKGKKDTKESKQRDKDLEFAEDLIEVGDAIFRSGSFEVMLVIVLLNVHVMAIVHLN